MNYIEQATKTESLDLFKVENPRLLHAAIGLSTEVAELLLYTDEVNLKEELGDLLWYIAIACDELKVTFDELNYLSTEVEDPMKEILRASGGALDLLKKGCFYGVNLNTVSLGGYLGQVLACIEDICVIEGFTVSEVQEANIAKLKRRYGDKFTTEAATNRDVDAERASIS